MPGKKLIVRMEKGWTGVPKNIAHKYGEPTYFSQTELAQFLCVTQSIISRECVVKYDEIKHRLSVDEATFKLGIMKEIAERLAPYHFKRISKGLYGRTYVAGESVKDDQLISEITRLRKKRELYKTMLLSQSVNSIQKHFHFDIEDFIQYCLLCERYHALPSEKRIDNMPDDMSEEVQITEAENIEAEEVSKKIEKPVHLSRADKRRIRREEKREAQKEAKRIHAEESAKRASKAAEAAAHAAAAAEAERVQSNKVIYVDKIVEVEKIVVEEVLVEVEVEKIVYVEVRPKRNQSLIAWLQWLNN